MFYQSIKASWGVSGTQGMVVNNFHPKMKKSLKYLDDNSDVQNMPVGMYSLWAK